MKPSFAWQRSVLTSFVRGNVAAGPPFAVLVDVTRRCNLQCAHCRIHSPAATALPGSPGALDFPLALFRSLCDEAGRMGVAKLVLIGEGEPMLHPDIIKMIACAATAGCQVVMLTNGTLLAARHARELGEAGLSELRVSLWAGDEEEYAALYPGSSPRLFRRAVSGLAEVAAARRAGGGRTPRLVLHRPIEPRFFRTVDRTLDLAVETSCDEISMSPLKPLLVSDMDRLLSAEEVRELVPLLRRVAVRAEAAGVSHNIDAVLTRFRIGCDVWKTLPCYIGWTDVRIRVNGDIVPCDTCDWLLGNLHEARLGELWNGHAFQQFRRATRRRDGILNSGHDCRCEYCCHAVTSQRMHRWLKWLAPFTARNREAPA